MLVLLTFFWFVQFTNKLGSAPIQFSERATENRIRWDIPTDSLDYAVVPAYVDSVRATGARICHVSRWMNGCTVEADSAVMSQIAALACVQSIELTRDNAKTGVSKRKLSNTSTDTNTFTNTPQLDFFNLRALHNLGYEGQGMRIAVIDLGFHNVNTAPCFDSVRSRILGAYDFSSENTSIYGSEGQHGANCLSFIAAQTSTYYGAATKAEYILIRTEEFLTESPKECDNLIAAYELCDSLGVDIITCSLGYRTFDNPAFNYTHAMLDGRTTRASRAAMIAARKGMLLCQSAGNDGDESWYKISVPCDADSILAMGAARLDTTMGEFSSYGPSADGRVKPDVSAVGVDAVFWNTATNQFAKGNGTSYATPLIAGLAACLWSALPNATAQDIRERIIQSAHLYPNHDLNNQMGYGIPDALKAYNNGPATFVCFPYGKVQGETSKILHNGQLYIVRGSKIYNTQGAEIR